jgi:hypothetical protein
MKLIEIAPNRFRFVRETLPPARSDLPRPYVISDEMSATEQVDGKFYTSKAAFRAVGRAHGLTEVGTEKFREKQRETERFTTRQKRREALTIAREKVRAGYRARSG